MLLEKYGPNRVKFFEGDLCDAPFITRIFETECVEWVVHMAARAGVRPSIEDPFVYVHSNVEATTRLLELSRLHGVKSFVFASSSSVYGGSQKEVTLIKISEAASLNLAWLGSGKARLVVCVNDVSCVYTKQLADNARTLF